MIAPVNDAIGKSTLTLGSYQTGTLTAGTPVTAKFTSRGLQNSYTFTATAKLHTTIDVTETDFGSGSADLRIVQPNGTAAVICKLAKTPTFCDFTPPVSGTWKAVLVPTSSSLGSAKLNLAYDQDKGTLALGTAAKATIGVKGQRAFWTFAGTASTQRIITVTGASWGTGGVANLNLYAPNGTRVLICPITGSTATCKFNVTAGGTWKAELAPIGNALGTATVKLTDK